jgi:pimeloyl-ACP methyl ester carboxylesterase
LRDPLTSDKDRFLARLGALASKADAYDPIAAVADETDELETQGDIFHSVWTAAAQLRRNGGLLELGRQIQCPVVALHGDDDPHPAQGVQKPLSALLKDFRFVLLRNCGHTPWLERQARASFYAALRAELARI